MDMVGSFSENCFSGYINSAEFEQLQEIILNHTSVNIAKIRIQVGGGTGIAARVAEGAKARFDLSGELGLSCELDYVALRGEGPLNLRDLLVGIQDVLDHPTTYLPDCPIIRSLYSEASGGGGPTQSSGTAGGERSRMGSSGGDMSGARYEGIGGLNGATQPSTEQKQTTSGRRESASSSGGGAISDLDISRNYPPGTPKIEFPILNVVGVISPNTAVDTTLRLTFIIQVVRAGNRIIPVPVEVRVVGNSESQIELEVVTPWWIEDLRIGSDTGHLHPGMATLRI
ncbi:MAG: hypothetical protein D3923_16365 [Candidatus Electrothrix sp. AR3]|nr:hypothetical protein [Candidatus Electrothrix sp. AR3]